MAEEWTKFRNLCNYYIDCVKYSEKRQEYLFSNQLNEAFILPACEINWHLKEEINIETSRAQRFARNLLLSAKDVDEIFIGYPLSSFISPTGTHCLCPIILFPVYISTLGEGRTSGLKIQIDRRGIDINREWIDFHIPQEWQLYFMRACERNSDDTGSIDVEVALQYISHHFEVLLDPNQMDFSLRHSDSHQGLLNTAALFIGGKTKYTRTLISELNIIKNESDAILDKTALAFIFRDPPLPIKAIDGIDKRIPAVFTHEPMNGPQFQAVEDALNASITKVTGPPGTGKSHVAVNLIANEVFNGGRVLFTSKNHKAIHAVFDMCQSAKPNSDFDLVEFCTVPGNDKAAQWDKIQDKLEQVKDLVTFHLQNQRDANNRDLPEEIAFHNLEEVTENLSIYRDAEQELKQYSSLKERVSRFERLIVDINDLVSTLPENVFHSPRFFSLLESCAEITDEEPRISKLHRLYAFIRRIIKKEEKKPDVITQLRVLAPELIPIFSRRSSISGTAKRLLKILKFKDVVEGWRLNEYDVINKMTSMYNYDTLKEAIKKSMMCIEKTLKKAYVEHLYLKVKNIDVDNLINKIKNEIDNYPTTPLPFMAKLGNENKYDKVIALFHELQTVLPAWGATILSLNKVSPCLPSLFSLVIIDEASQCEIPPMIPALYRSERITVIGDPEQFPPVITIKEKRNEALQRKYHLTDAQMKKFSFCANNVFSVIPNNKEHTFRLIEHFRCIDDIAMYFNREFYKGELCPCAGSRKSEQYSAYNLKPGMDWLEADGGDEMEANIAIGYLSNLKKSNFRGTVGIISPFRRIANEMKRQWYNKKEVLPEGLIEERINTANAFQGGQCDIIVFLLGLNKDRTPGRDLWYITADENKYIYNVSVSRAKLCFVTIGDKHRALDSGISHIVNLIPSEQPPINTKIGPGEIKLKDALIKAGFNPEPQYPILGRYLDLALVDKKIDIEVDGQAWHLDINGCRKADDIHRDLLLEANHWRVIRFWHNEVMTDLEGCVSKIKQLCEE